MNRNENPTRRVAIYARLSVTTEESVSIERQVESARKYAEARGWEVVLEAVDDGVSATKNRPEARVGWRRVLDSPESYEAVVVWKIDRLARRVLDFLHADEALKERGAGIVAVEDPVDMTTAQGRAFATMLAVFGEMEAAAISARVTAARRAIVHAGRRAGGRVPYGWRNAPNPHGPGVVLEKDPERIGVVEDLVARALAGESFYAMAKRLTEEGVPAPGRAGSATEWAPSAVETVLRLPSLAGLTPYRGDVVRDVDGLPVVDESVAVVSPEERRTLLRLLDERKKPRGGRVVGAPALLSGLVRCGRCGKALHRATTVNGTMHYYRCANGECPGSVGGSRPRMEEAVVEEFLKVAGRLPVVERVEEAVDFAPRLVEVEAAILDTLASMGEDGADVAVLAERLARLKTLRTEARVEAGSTPETYEVPTGETFAEAWARVDDVAERSALLRTALTAVYLEPATKRGNTFDADRLVYRWRGSEESRVEGLE